MFNSLAVILDILVLYLLKSVFLAISPAKITDSYDVSLWLLIALNAKMYDEIDKRAIINDPFPPKG